MVIATNNDQSSGGITNPDGSKKRIFLLFDTDGTLTECGRNITPEVRQLLKTVREEVTIGVTGGLMLYKMKERLGPDVVRDFDFCFPENGTVAYKDGKLVYKKSVAEFLGEKNIKMITEYALNYFRQLDLPFRCGTFVDFRTGIINFSPAGRHLAPQLRTAFAKLDARKGIRKQMQKDFTAQFGSLGVEFLIGGAVGMDMVPRGWDKTLCLESVDSSQYDEIHYFGDKYHPGENDYYLLTDSRTIGHPINGPHETARIIAEVLGWSHDKLSRAMTSTVARSPFSTRVLSNTPVTGRARQERCLLFDLHALVDVPTVVLKGSVPGLTAEARKVLMSAQRHYDLAVVHNDRYEVISDLLGSEDIKLFRYIFAEYGGVAYENGSIVETRSMTEKLGLDNLNAVTKYALKLVVDSEVEHRRGTFVDFRNSVIGFSPAGKYIQQEQMRSTFIAKDRQVGIRHTFIRKMQEKFAHLDLEFIRAANLTVDMVPRGWNKQLALQVLFDAKYMELYAFEAESVVEHGGDVVLDTVGRNARVVQRPSETFAQVSQLISAAQAARVHQTRNPHDIHGTGDIGAAKGSQLVLTPFGPLSTETLGMVLFISTITSLLITMYLWGSSTAGDRIGVPPLFALLTLLLGLATYAVLQRSGRRRGALGGLFKLWQRVNGTRRRHDLRLLE